MKKKICLLLIFVLIMSCGLSSLVYAETDNNGQQSTEQKQKNDDKKAEEKDESKNINGEEKDTAENDTADKDGVVDGATENKLQIQSKSALLMDANTGNILYQYNEHEKLRPASVTKVMTLLLAYEAIANGERNLDDIVTVSENAAGYGGSTILLEADEKIKFDLLIKGMCVASGNDAAVATAEFVGGSQQGFVDMMNARAKELGMNDTFFANPCGLVADGHLTSAHDIALMSRELITKFPEVLEYTKIWHAMLPHKWRKGDGETDMANTNKLLKTYKGVTGLKTGFTRESLYSISTTAERDGLSLIAVVMGGETKDMRTQDVVTLLDYGFGNYRVLTEKKAGNVAGKIKVSKGSVNYVEGIIKEDLKVLVKKNEVKDGKIEIKIEMPERIQAPLKKGQKVGEIHYLIGGKQIATGDIILNQDVEKSTFTGAIKKLIQMWF